MAPARRYTVLLLATGGFFIALSAVMHSVFMAVDAPPILTPVFLVLGAYYLVAGSLRSARAHCLPELTEAVTLLGAFAVPVGSLVAGYWYSKIRAREVILATSATKRTFAYSVALLIAGFFLILSVVTISVLLWTDLGSQVSLRILAAFFVFLAVFCTTVAILRGLAHRWAYRSTLAVSSLLLLLVPWGTILAVVWFTSIRKADKSNLLLSQP